MTAENWLKALSDNGYRLTDSRRAVVEIVGASTRAMTPMEVFDSARATHPELGLVTVYRTLEKLEQLHLIQRVHDLLSKSSSGCQAFVSAGQGHQHMLLCQACGQVTFFEGDDLDNLITAISADTGYTIREHWLQLFGLCAQCR